MNSFFTIFKKFWVLLLIGLVLRLVLASTTFHLDTRQQMIPSSGYFSGNWDVYQFSRSLNIPLDKLPMSYFLEFPLRLPFHFFIDQQKENIFLISPNKLFGDPWIYGYLTYAKIPFIVFDLLVGLGLAYIVEEKKRKKILLLWLFNPITLWASMLIGQIDIYISFFILLSYIFIVKQKYFWAAAAIGIGAAIKSAPFLVLPLLLNMVSGWKSKIAVLFLGVIPSVITIIPYINSVDFRKDALLAPQLTKMLYASLPLSGGESIFISLALIIVIYLWFFQKKRSSDDYLKICIAIFLLILSLTHFHLQWILWPLPLLTIWLMDHWEVDIKLAISIGFLSFVMMLFLFEASLQIRLFSPIFPQLDSVNGLWESLTSERLIFFRSLSASFFAGSVVYLCLQLFKKDQ